MARRFQTGSREQLTPAELGELRQRLASMTLNELEIYYRASHNSCGYGAMRLPSARMVQEFVQAWKALRKVRG